MTRYLVSDADTWPAISRDPQRLSEVLDWMRANNINPDDVPTDTTVTIESTNPEGALVIRHEVFLRNDDGCFYLADPDDAAGDAAREWRVTPLTVLPPVNWPMAFWVQERATAMAGATKAGDSGDHHDDAGA